MAEAKKTRVGQYEGMFLFGSNAAQDLAGAQNVVRGFIEKHGGSILVLKKWDERKLAYEIKKQKRGVYIVAYFNAPTTAVSAIEREVNLSEEVLRVLITDAEHLNQSEMEAVEPQPIVRSEPPAWDRPAGGGGFDGPPRGDRPPRGPRRSEETADAGAKD
jgi:small subunit ribosomal protein S6